MGLSALRQGLSRQALAKLSPLQPRRRRRTRRRTALQILHRQAKVVLDTRSQLPTVVDQAPSRTGPEIGMPLRPLHRQPMTRCPKCNAIIPLVWLEKGCGRFRIYTEPPQLHHPEPPYTLSEQHCIECWYTIINTPIGYEPNQTSR